MKLREELDEYRKRHPSNIGEKNGKSYEIKPATYQRERMEMQRRISRVFNPAIMDISSEYRG